MMAAYHTYLKFLIAFPLTIALAYFCLRFFIHRFGFSLGMGQRIQIVERVALNPRIFLYVVKVGDEYLLIASTSTGITLLKDLSKSWEENDLEKEQPAKKESYLTFNTILAYLKRKH